MWKFWKKRDPAKQLPPGVAAAIIVSMVALCLSIGVARWSWLMLDEQIRLRKDFADLRNEQDQANIQYEYWNAKVQEERQRIKQGQ